MDCPPNPTKEAIESVNLGDKGLFTSDPSESFKSEINAPVEPTKALLRIFQDMPSVLDRLIAPKAMIDMVRKIC